ncbi:hypothetical protein [Kribbella sp. NPDC051770]|uniref:hypothetical protein n=1 Tax=Kribbella sp. NPDC051770 TaxID=3155413 RepID=UPI0034261AF1
MTTRIPAERTLPNRQEILERVLADQEGAVRRRRGWVVPVSAAAGIAVIVGGVVALGDDPRVGGEPPVAGTPTSAAPTAGTPTAAAESGKQPADVVLNLGPSSPADANALARACADSVGRISRALKLRSWAEGGQTENSVVVEDPSTDRVYGCVGEPTKKTRTGQTVDGFELTLLQGKAPKITIEAPDARHPAAPRDGTGSVQAYIAYDREPDVLMTAGWYQVDARVALVRQRYVFADRVGPWYVGGAIDGYVFLRSWDKQQVLRKGDRVRVETQVVDAQGNLLDAPAQLKGGGGLTRSPGTTRVDVGTVTDGPDGFPTLAFP